MMLYPQGMAVCVAVSIVAAVTVLLILPRLVALRYAGAVGLAAGFFAAYAFFEQKSFVPTLPWQWLPWLVLIASIIGPIGLAQGIGTIERCLLAAIFALAAAWLLVPTWKALASDRHYYVLGLAGVIVLEWNLLDRLMRTNPVATSLALAATLLSTGALASAVGSIRVGIFGVVAAMAVLGGGLGFLWKRDGTILRGMLAAQSVILCEVLLNARLYETMKYPAIALMLVSPLTLGLFAAGPLAKLKGNAALFAKTAAVAAPQVVAWWLDFVATHATKAS